MSKLRIYAAHDTKISAFLPPMFVQHVGQILRIWADLANDSTTNVGKYPADFHLYEIGEFNTETAMIEPKTPITLIQTALEARATNQEPLPLAPVRN